MYKIILSASFFLFSLFSFSQEMFVSTSEVGKKSFVPTIEFKTQISTLLDRAIGTEKGEFGGIYDVDFYELKNGNISYGPYVEWMYVRLIFDKNLKLIERQDLSHCDVQQEEEYYQFMPKMIKAVEGKYTIDGCTNYIKITIDKGYWYEVKAKKVKKTVTLIYDKDLKFVGVKK